MTRFGAGCLLAGAGLVAAGWETRWTGVLVLGIVAVAAVSASWAYVARRPRLRLDRAVEPARVEKGLPAIAVVDVTNLSRRALRPLMIEQRVGGAPVRGLLPRLPGGERGIGTYRLPTSVRGVYEIGPVEVHRADPFGFCRTVQRLGASQRIAVHPRLLAMRPLPAGMSRNLEGPSSDASPQGSVTFHRLREYAVGDDLRTVHWPSTARAGTLVVRHFVDTAQPYTVVLADVHPDAYSAESFEEAVDAAASVVSSMASGKAPVQLRLTNGVAAGGPAQRDPTPLVDLLTDVRPDPAADLLRELAVLRRERGGTSLVLVTGRMPPVVLPVLSSLRRRFDRVVAVSMVDGPSRPPHLPGVAVVEVASVDDLARRWNRGMYR